MSMSVNLGTSRSRQLQLILLLILLGMLIWLYMGGTKKDGVKPRSTASAPTAPAPLSGTTTPVASHHYDERVNTPNSVTNLTIEETKVLEGPRTIKVKRGDSVNIEIRAVKEEVRIKLEGYNIITENHPSDNVPGGFNFIADKVGSFKYYALPEEEEGHQNDTPTLLGTIIVE